MVSLRKHSDEVCFYSARPGGTRRLPKFNHTVLEGLWDIVPEYPARKEEDLVQLEFSTCNPSNIAIM